MGDTINYTININGNMEAAVGKLIVSSNKAADGFTRLTDKISKIGALSFTFNNINSTLQNFSASLDNAIVPGKSLNTSMLDLSAITGVIGGKLKEIEGYARNTAKTFGGSAAQGVESYKLVLSQLSPEIAKTPAALRSMGNSIATLSKTMKGDTVAATEVLTTAMNQYQVSLADPIAASKVMADMMNIMSAAAKEGSAELPAQKEALENSGMAAKMANVAFAELSASIQVLDKAGKKGAEGGVAIRNVLATLSEGRFLPRETIKALKKAGVNINDLGDKSLTFSQRLQKLQPVMNDTALITKLFGKENQNAALALISGVPEIERYTKVITGTNSANEQAQIVMSSFAEKMSRYRARWDDLKISIFQHTQNAIPAFKAAVFTAQGAAAALTMANAFGTMSEAAWFIAIKERTRAMWKAIPATWALISSEGTWLGVSLLAVIATKALSNAVTGLGKAIYNIPIIGWIAAGIALLVGLFKLLWDKSEKFRQILFGVWEATKAVFYNIGVVISALWQGVIKPVFSFIGDTIKTVIGGIWIAIKWVGSGIVSVFQSIVDFFATVWGGITSVFSGIAGWLNANLLQPIKGVFASLWDFISKILDNIINALMKPIRWIKSLWNKIFPKNQFKDIGESYAKGVVKGSESWAKSQKAKKEDGVAAVAAIVPAAIAGQKPAGKTPPINNGAGKTTEDISSGGKRSTSINIQFKNMVEKMVFDGTLSEKRTDMEREVASVMARILGMARSIS